MAKKKAKRRNPGGSVFNPPVAETLEPSLALSPTLAAAGSASSSHVDAQATEEGASSTTTSDNKRKREDGEDDSGWQTVERKAKKPKKVPKSDGHNYPAITFAPGQGNLTSKIKTADLRNLIIYLFGDGPAPHWVAVKNRNQFRKAVVLYIPGLEEALFQQGVDLDSFLSPEPSRPKSSQKLITSPDDYYPRTLDADKLAPELKPFADVFTRLWPVKSPGLVKTGHLHSPVVDFMTAPLSKREKEMARLVKESAWRDARTPITHFLLTRDQMAAHKYPMHPILLDSAERESFQPLPGFYYTAITDKSEAEIPDEHVQQGSITVGRTVISVDCEMVAHRCEDGTSKFLLARITLVSWDGERLLDKFVKPLERIDDYHTQFSGITPEILANVTTTIHDIHAELRRLITPQTILVGHSLESDLNALNFSHPFLVDTAILYPHKIPNRKNRLRDLSQRFLGLTIQDGAHGHDSAEDALAALELTKLKCEKGPRYGIPSDSGIDLFLRLQKRVERDGAAAAPAAPGAKKTAFVDRGHDAARGVGANADVKISCRSDEEVEAGVVRAVEGDPDGREVPGGGVDFVFARLRDVEKCREWDVHPARARKSEPGADSDPAEGSGNGNAAATSEPSSPKSLSAELGKLSARISRIHDALPPCTVLVVFSGHGNPLEQQSLFARRDRYNKALSKGSDPAELGIKWTPKDAERLAHVTQAAMNGIGFIAVK